MTTGPRMVRGVSPAEREFDRATAIGAHRLIFVKGTDNGARHPKMRVLIGKAQTGLIRKRFNTPEELVTGLYAALVEYLEVKELIRWGPFDTAPCIKAALDNLDFERMARFIRTARRARQFPLTEDSSPEELLEHLNLLNDGRFDERGGVVIREVAAAVSDLLRNQVRPLSRDGGCQADPVLSGLQRHCVRTGRSGSGLRAEARSIDR